LFAGFLLRPHFSISKIWATPTWSFYSVAICTVLFVSLYYVVDIYKKTSWASWLKPAAKNPLLIYIIPTMLLNVQNIFGFSIVPDFASKGLIGVVWAFGFALVMIWVVKWFNKINIRLHL
jgi:predicted acyltransferase